MVEVTPIAKEITCVAQGLQAVLNFAIMVIAKVTEIVFGRNHS